jgi:ComF family protein
LIRIDHEINIVKDRFRNSPFADEAISLLLFRENTPVQSLIHNLKYGQMKSIGKTYGNILGENIIKNLKIDFDLIIPVPLHRSKRRERGYNQSDYISSGLEQILKLEVINKCLKRVRYTKTQTKLTREERKENVSNAFKLNEKFTGRLNGKNIVLVDDVITTGATILECARILKENGCGKILTCSIALAE